VIIDFRSVGMRVILAARLPVLMSWAAKPAFEDYSGRCGRHSFGVEYPRRVWRGRKFHDHVRSVHV
jgi:hypothetical protein